MVFSREKVQVSDEGFGFVPRGFFFPLPCHGWFVLEPQSPAFLEVFGSSWMLLDILGGSGQEKSLS